MSVKLLDNKAFYGYRVRRTVDGELYQEYHSLKASGKRLVGANRKTIEKKAHERDQELEIAQQKARDASKDERCFNADGTVKGISYLLKTEKSGNLTPIFQVGIASELQRKTVCTSFSLNAHGTDGAWEKAVDAYAKHKIIKCNSKLYKRLKIAMPLVG
ncbi:MAG: hypothetical protein ACI9OO_001173 [Bacteroidia bacterium]|jgi:hypothetical protein